MPLIALSPAAIAALIPEYLLARARWIQYDIRRIFDLVRETLISAYKSGEFASHAEMAEQFLVPRLTITRILSNRFGEVGRDAILLLARDLGIAEGPSRKLSFLLKDLLPEFVRLRLTGPVDPQAVEKAVDKLGRLDLTVFGEPDDYELWAASQLAQLPWCTRATLDAAALWLVLRPRLPGYRSFLVQRARATFNKQDGDLFEARLNLLCCLRRTALSISEKHALELADLDEQKAWSVTLEYMSDTLRERSPSRFDAPDIAMGFLGRYQLELTDLLNLRLGELFEKSPLIREMSTRLLMPDGTDSDAGS